VTAAKARSSGAARAATWHGRKGITLHFRGKRLAGQPNRTGAGADSGSLGGSAGSQRCSTP
jgi:hypothetical protein